MYICELLLVAIGSYTCPCNVVWGHCIYVWGRSTSYSVWVGVIRTPRISKACQAHFSLHHMIVHKDSSTPFNNVCISSDLVNTSGHAWTIISSDLYATHLTHVDIKGLVQARAHYELLVQRVKPCRDCIGDPSTLGLTNQNFMQIYTFLKGIATQGAKDAGASLIKVLW